MRQLQKLVQEREDWLGLTTRNSSIPPAVEAIEFMLEGGFYLWFGNEVSQREMTNSEASRDNPARVFAWDGRNMFRLSP